MSRYLVLISLTILSLTTHAQNKPYQLSLMVNGVAVNAEPIYDQNGTPMADGALYENAKAVRIGEDSLSLSAAVISDYVGSSTVMCDLIVETHFGYQVYQLSEYTTLAAADVSDVGEGRNQYACSFNDISQLMASSGTFMEGGEYLLHIWFMPLSNRISNIPLLVKGEQEQE